MNLLDMLMCPECKSDLSEESKCKGCNNQYDFRNSNISRLRNSQKCEYIGKVVKCIK